MRKKEYFEREKWTMTLANLVQMYMMDYAFASVVGTVHSQVHVSHYRIIGLDTAGVWKTKQNKQNHFTENVG
jgi:hypothetical protein